MATNENIRCVVFSLVLVQSRCSEIWLGEHAEIMLPTKESNWDSWRKRSAPRVGSSDFVTGSQVAPKSHLQGQKFQWGEKCENTLLKLTNFTNATHFVTQMRDLFWGLLSTCLQRRSTLHMGGVHWGCCYGQCFLGEAVSELAPRWCCQRKTAAYARRCICNTGKE